MLYRVRKTWADPKSQIGAYKNLDNAKKACDKHPGYFVFDDNGKVVYPIKKKRTKQDKMCAWAKMIAKSGKFKYVRWSSKNKKTQTCPICSKRVVLKTSYDEDKNVYKLLDFKVKDKEAIGGNCIWGAWHCWHHSGIPSRCSCGVVSNDIAEKILKAKTDAEALKIAQKYVGIKDIEVIRNKGKNIPIKNLKKGDVVFYFKGDTYFHTVLYIGLSKIAESNTTNPNIRYGVKISPSYVKLAIRYIG